MLLPLQVRCSNKQCVQERLFLCLVRAPQQGTLASLPLGCCSVLSAQLTLLCLPCSPMRNSSRRRRFRKAKRRSSSRLLQAPHQTSNSA